MQHDRIRNALAVAIALAVVLSIPRFLRPDAIVITRAMTATTIAEVWVEQDSGQASASLRTTGACTPPSGGL